VLLKIAADRGREWAERFARRKARTIAKALYLPDHPIMEM
jgi:hypothetical protein